MKRVLLMILGLFILLIPNSAKALNTVHFYFFHGDGCPHCAEEKEWLQEMQEKYANLEVHLYETWSNVENENLMVALKEHLEINTEKPKAVPFTVIGEDTYIGFNQSIGEKMEESILTYSYQSYEDKTGVFLGLYEELSQGEDLKTNEEVEEKQEEVKIETAKEERKEKIWIPLFIVAGVSLLCISIVGILYYRKKDN